MVIDEQVYLEHFGVKGMRWGVRRSKEERTSKTPEEKAKRKKQIKVAAAVVGAGAIAVGAFIARDMLKQYGSQKLSTLPKTPQQKAAKDFVNSQRKIKVDAIKRTHKEGHMDKQQAKEFLKTLNARYDRKVVDAMRNAI